MSHTLNFYRESVVGTFKLVHSARLDAMPDASMNEYGDN